MWACYAHCHWDVPHRDRVGTVLRKRAEGRLVRQFWDRANPQSQGSSRLERTADLGGEGHCAAGYRARVGCPAHGRGLAGAQRRVVTLQAGKPQNSPFRQNSSVGRSFRRNRVFTYSQSICKVQFLTANFKKCLLVESS